MVLMVLMVELSMEFRWLRFAPNYQRHQRVFGQKISAEANISTNHMVIATLKQLFQDNFCSQKSFGWIQKLQKKI